MADESALILFVDDEAVVRRVIGDALTQAGYRVICVPDAATALDRLRQPDIDLLLLDLRLGDDDGLDVMRAARQLRPELPVIILTAHGSLSSAIEAIRYAAGDYLLKPVSMETLRSRVAEALGRRRAQLTREERLRAMYTQIRTFMQDEGLLDSELEELPPADTTAIPVAAPTVYRAGPLYMDVLQHIVQMHGQYIDLTPTEYAILVELVRKPGTVVSFVRLAQALQHHSLDEEEARQMMRPHIVRLRRKIEPDPRRPVYIQSVRGIGYRWGVVQ